MDPWSRWREVARGVLRSSPKPFKKSISFAIGKRSRFIACFPQRSDQMRLCQTPGRFWPLITGRFENTAVRGPALDAISIRAAGVCVPLLLCAGWREHTAVSSLVAVKTRPHPNPCPFSEARAAVCPTWPRNNCDHSVHGHALAISMLSFAAAA